MGKYHDPVDEINKGLKDARQEGYQNGFSEGIRQGYEEAAEIVCNNAHSEDAIHIYDLIREAAREI